MKKNIFHAVFMAGALAISISAILQAQNPVRATGPTAQGTPNSTNVAVIDIGYILEHHPNFKLEMEAIAKDAKGFDEYTMQQRTKMSKSTERLRTLESGSAEYRKLEEDIAGFDTNMKVEFSRKQRELAERKTKIIYDAYKEIEVSVAEFAERYGFDMVVRFDSTVMDENNRESIYKSVAKFVVYQRGRDITKPILDQLARSARPTPTPNSAPVTGRSGVSPGANSVPIRNAERPQPVGGVPRSQAQGVKTR